MKEEIDNIIKFINSDIWQIRKGDVAPMKFFFINILKKLLLTLKFFTARQFQNEISALTYATLFAVIPICAVIFGVASGFGFEKYLTEWFYDAFSSQPQVAQAIVEFVNSYLRRARGGVILGFGLILMVWSVFKLIHNIETTFNEIWQVNVQRPWGRITDYFALFFIVPIVIVLSMGLSIFLSEIADQTASFLLLSGFIRFLISILPYFLLSSVFIAMYMYMPNVNVKFKAAVGPGILAGVAMQMLQFVYIHSQSFLSSYNAIYGSFAAIPLFMLWVQFSWTICLFGAELSYTNQNLEQFAYLADPNDISIRYRNMLSLILLEKICQRFQDGKTPYTAIELKQETSIPIRIVTDLLDRMTKVNLINASFNYKGDKTVYYQPAEALANMSVGKAIDKLEAYGTWKLDLDLHLLVGSNHAWRKYYSARKNYLSRLNDIPVMDLHANRLDGQAGESEQLGEDKKQVEKTE